MDTYIGVQLAYQHQNIVQHLYFNNFGVSELCGSNGNY